MPKLRGPDTAVERLPLSDGDWVDIKKELSVGEERSAYSLAITGVTREGDYKVDPALHASAMLAVRIVSWSFLGRDEQPMPYDGKASLKQRVSWLEALDTETKTEIDEAFAVYQKAREVAKKALITAPDSSPISPSANG